MDAQIRAAAAGDATAIGAVQVRAWQRAYRGIMPDDHLDGIDPDQRAAMWRDLLDGDHPDRRILVATASDRVVGFAAFGAARRDATDGELYAINVDPDAWAAGLGRRLLRTATESLADAGFTRAELFVASANERARRLYESEGWTTDGVEVVEDALGVEVREVRYRRRLSG